MAEKNSQENETERMQRLTLKFNAAKSKGGKLLVIFKSGKTSTITVNDQSSFDESHLTYNAGDITAKLPTQSIKDFGDFKEPTK